jgi:hypothetical protein
VSINVDTRHSGELKHYFRHADFGARSPQLEILCGTHSLEVNPPQWPAGAVHSTMIRVFERLVLAEGLRLAGHALPPGEAFPGRYQGWCTEQEMRDLPASETGGRASRWLAPTNKKIGESEAGAYLVLCAYYGIYGIQRGLASGTTFENTKEGAECEDPEIAVYPLTGLPMEEEMVDVGLGRDYKFHSRHQIIGELRKLRGPNAKALRERAIEMIRRAHRAYDSAARLHERITLSEAVYA